MSGNSLQRVREPLSVTELKFVTWIEQFWNQNHKFPAEMTIRSRWGEALVDYKETLNKPVFIEALSNRGITMPADGTIPDELTAEQIAAVSLILDYSDKRSHNTKLRSLGLSPTKWAGWLKNPVFKTYLHNLSTRNLDDALHVAHEGLLKATERGDVNAIKYYMELTGRFSEDAGQQQNFKVMIQRIIESIQRHVKDPDVIRLLAADFDVIMQGGIPSNVPVLEKGSI